MAKKKKYTGKKKNDGDEDLCSHYFGGKNEVRRRLVEAVRKGRERRKMTRPELDKRCYFKEDGLPTCSQFEDNPSKMTQEVFCRAACELDLKIDKILKIDFSSRKNLKATIETMRANKGGLVAAFGTKAEAIAEDTVAPVYAAFKVLSEI